MSISEIVAKYGYMGFCRKAKVWIAYTVSNILLCDGCPEFVDVDGRGCYGKSR